MKDLDENILKVLLESKQYRQIRDILTESEPSDIADLIVSIPAEEALLVFRVLPKNLAVDVFDQLDGTHQNKILESFSDQAAGAFLEQMPPDDRAELLDEVPSAVARRLLRALSPDERLITLQLLGYKDGTAGREMTPFFVDLRADRTVEQALDRVRQLAIDRETIYQCYVMDHERHLTGTVSLKDIVLADREALVEDIMIPNPSFVRTSTDREEVARIIREHDLLAIPVVDAEERLVGIITQDDVVDILEEEATEDMYRFGAVPGTERGYFTSRILSVVKRRVGWLFLLILVNTITGSIIAGQEALLAEVVILAAFVPLLIGTGGNVGAQSATVVIRGLATGEVHPRRAFTIILREVGVGSILGLVLGVVVLAWAYLLGRDLQVAVVVSTTLVAISMMATLTGGTLPFLFRLLKLDPALVSAPFITTVLDVFGVTFYFFIAHLILHL